MKKALGKGLSALIPDSYKNHMAATEKEIPVTTATVTTEPETRAPTTVLP